MMSAACSTAGEEVIRPIARIDGLDQDRDVALRARCIRRRLEIADEGPLGGGTVLRRHFPRKAMNLASTDGGGRSRDFAQNNLANSCSRPGMAPTPNSPPASLPRARIDPQHGQAMPIELRLHSGRRVIIRKLQLHGRKASCRRRLQTARSSPVR